MSKGKKAGKVDERPRLYALTRTAGGYGGHYWHPN
jgi:hypothetical protein